MESMKTAVNAYQTVQVDAAVMGAGPHELISKLLARSIEAVSDAKGFMQKGDVLAKGREINVASAIIVDGLQASLNMEAGGEVAANLDGLYDYMVRQLITAHAENNPEMLGEVTSLLQEIKSGWDGIKSVNAANG